MSNNNPNPIDITQLSGVSNVNKLNITGIAYNIFGSNYKNCTNNGNITIDNIESEDIDIDINQLIHTNDDSTIIDNCNCTGVITVNDEQIGI